ATNVPARRSGRRQASAARERPRERDSRDRDARGARAGTSSRRRRRSGSPGSRVWGDAPRLRPFATPHGIAGHRRWSAGRARGASGAKGGGGVHEPSRLAAPSGWDLGPLVRRALAWCSQARRCSDSGRPCAGEPPRSARSHGGRPGVDRENPHPLPTHSEEEVPITTHAPTPPRTSPPAAMEWSQIEDVGCYLMIGTGELARIPKEGLALGHSPLITLRSVQDVRVAKLSDNPAEPISVLRATAADNDYFVNF